MLRFIPRDSKDCALTALTISFIGFKDCGSERRSIAAMLTSRGRFRQGGFWSMIIQIRSIESLKKWL